MPAGPTSPSAPAVDVGIPTRGAGPYLGAAVKSVIGQSFRDWSLTISYNGPAPPAPAESVRELLGDSRVSFDPSGEELSAAANHTRLVRAGTAPYLAILHDDDLWEPTFLRRRVDFLEAHPEVGWVFSETAIIDEDGTVLRRSRRELAEGVHEPARFVPSLLRYNYAGVPSRVLMRRTALEAVGPYFDERFLYWDWELWVRLAVRFPSGYLAATDVATRIHAQQQTFQIRPDRSEQLAFREHIESVARSSPTAYSPGFRDSRRPRSDILLSQALDHAEDGRQGAALDALRAALRTYPLRVLDVRIVPLALALALGGRGAGWLARTRNRALALGTRRGIRLHRR